MFRTNTNPRAPATPYFPTFLLPSIKIPFLRRRQSSATTATSETFHDVPSLSSSPTTTISEGDFPISPTDGATVESYTYGIQDDKIPVHPSATHGQPLKQRPLNFTRERLARTLPDVLRCNTCGTDVAYGLQIVSKGFTGRYGRALLVAAPLATSTPSCPGSPLSNGSAHGAGSHASVSPGHYALAQESANLVNIVVGRPEPRNLVTGAHVVADINCATCGVKIGWKYVDAREQAQKYKVGKFILETERVVLLRTWEDVPADDNNGLSRHFYSSSAPVGPFGVGGRRSSVFSGGRKLSCSPDKPDYVEDDENDEDDEEGSSSGETEEEIAFDSDDEDECEDIFAGVWDAATVARRRNSRASAGSHRSAKKSRAAKGSR